MGEGRETARRLLPTKPPCYAVEKASLYSFRVNSMGSLYQTESFLTACIHSLLRRCMSQASRVRVNRLRVRTHQKKSGDAVRRLGTIIQSIFCAQSGVSIRLTVWKWSGESGVVYHLPQIPGISCWNVNGNFFFFYSSHWKIAGTNGNSEKLFPFSLLGRSEWKFVYHSQLS